MENVIYDVNFIEHINSLLSIDTKTYIENHVCENLRDGLEENGLCKGRYGNCISCKAADNPSMPKHRTFLECQVNSYATTEDICSPGIKKVFFLRL